MSSAKGATGTRRPLVGGYLSRSLAAAAKPPRGLEGPSTSPAAWLLAGYRPPRRRAADLATAWTRRLKNGWSVIPKWLFPTVATFYLAVPIWACGEDIPLNRMRNTSNPLVEPSAQPHQAIGEFMLLVAVMLPSMIRMANGVTSLLSWRRRRS
jgi:hypothetical protein